VPVSPEYRAYVEDQLGRFVRLRSRRMFGGVGLYADDLFFALIDDDVLYLKVDDATRPRYETRGMAPFRPTDEMSMSYYPLPGGVLDDPEELRSWADEAVEVARRAKVSKERGSRRKKSREGG
jgi:DNA transformation protein